MMRKMLLKSYTFDLTNNSEPTNSEHRKRSSQKHPPWFRSSSQPAASSSSAHKNSEFKEISDGNWTYCYDSEIASGIPIKGFGNVPIVSYEDIAKMSDRRLRVCSITWNINEKPAKILNYLAQKIKEHSDHLENDIFFVSLQEIPSTAKTFHEDVLKILEPVVKSHSLYLSHRAWSQMIIVFIRKHHLKYAIQPQVSFIPSGPMAKPVRTKGAIAVCLRLYQRWIVLIGSHLSHATSQQRVQDYTKIINSLRFGSLKKFHAHGKDDLFSTDVIFWAGDLNFRITLENRVDWKKHETFETGVYDGILEAEELATLRGKGIAFAEFAEQNIRFPPTHKFEPDTDEYVARRIPSYTDRVLYWARNPEWLNSISYDSLRGPCPSDHKPVFATFWVTVINKPIPKKYYSADSANSLISSDSTRSLSTSMDGKH